MAEAERAFDQKKLERFSWRTSQQVAAAMNVSLSHVGDQLGLFKAIRKIGPVTSTSLSEYTKLHERWLREWLRHQACNGHLDYDEQLDAFSISNEAAAVLCDEDSPYYFASGFNAFAATQFAATKLPEIFRTGIGLSYDDHGASCACGIERLNNYVPRFVLIQEILPEIDGLIELLEQGISVADVGCGAGTALLQMAKSFPNSDFIGYEISTHALKRARANLEEQTLANVQVKDARVDPMPGDHRFDLICTFDVVHDVPYPDRLIADIYFALKSEGVWLCSDIRSFPKFEDNLNENPHAALMYGFSLLVCMSSAMSEEGGAGLGTLGFNVEVAERMARGAGFTSFKKLEYENAVNSYYEIRP